jgi:transaldolase
MTKPLKQLLEHGQSPWLDYISRDFVRGGDLAGLIDDGIVGLTSNPTIFQGAISKSDMYDEQLREVLQNETDPKEVFFALAQEDIRGACDLLRPVFDRGEKTRDGWVSLEVEPGVAHDAEATAKQAQRLHKMVGRPNLFIKIPGTEEGLEAIEETIAAGIPVNVTLLFSLQRHRQAAEAYLKGLRRLRESGGDLSTVTSVASFFVSRVDTEADRRLDEMGGHDELKGKLAIANAKLAYQTYKELFSGSDWQELEAAGASPQRCLWASTSTKEWMKPSGRWISSPKRGSTTTTSWGSWSARAWRSSRSRSMSCLKAWPPSVTNWWRRSHGGCRIPPRTRSTAPRRFRPIQCRGRLGSSDLLDVGRRPHGGPAGRLPEARLPEPG